MSAGAGRLAGRRVRAALVAAALACLGLAPAASAARAAWSRPFQFATPGSFDYAGPQLAFSPTGSALAAFGIGDVDVPGVSQAYLSTRSAGGAVTGPRAIPGAAEILALAYDQRSPELLTGSSPAGLTCCSSVQAVKVGAGGVPQRARTLVGGLTGATDAQLLTLADGQMLAAVATERGVWALQSTSANRFGAAHLLTAAGQMPEALSAAWLGGENTIVAWTAATGPAGAAVARTIDVSGGTRVSAPHRSLAIHTVPSGHRIDELAVARRGAGATAAWIESWYDAAGAFHSQVQAADLSAHPVVRAVSGAGGLASGLSFSADAAGDQVLSWSQCTVQGVCAAQAAVRAAHGAFSAPRTLGPVDPSQAPASAIGPAGQVLVGWIDGGRPFAALAPAPPAAFGSPASLSTTAYALSMTVASGPGGRALAAWSQGTLNPSIVGAAWGAG